MSGQSGKLSLQVRSYNFNQGYKKVKNKKKTRQMCELAEPSEYVFPKATISHRSNFGPLCVTRLKIRFFPCVGKFGKSSRHSSRPTSFLYFVFGAQKGLRQKPVYFEFKPSKELPLVQGPGLETGPFPCVQGG